MDNGQMTLWMCDLGRINNWVPTLPKGVRQISPELVTTAEGNGDWLIVPPCKIDDVKDPEAGC